MSYASIDTLQKALSEQVFSRVHDSKKAAGRALGTLVEVITYHLLREWGLVETISIERGLGEYGNADLTHNVEFTLHPIIDTEQKAVRCTLPITSTKIWKDSELPKAYTVKKNTLLDSERTLRNACVIAESEEEVVLVNDVQPDGNAFSLQISTQLKQPYAMIECKRVGVEEGLKKGPQTIEKAKQGAYVAQRTSSLQKIRNNRGEKYGIIYEGDTPIIKPYEELLRGIVRGEYSNLLRGFVMSIGVISNHGNWFTSENPNKELRVLAQSYDRLLFLSDDGLARFVEDLILAPSKEYESARTAFMGSYVAEKTGNQFTKVKMSLDAHIAVCRYFHSHLSSIESWFSIVSPENVALRDLKAELTELKGKNWNQIL